MYFMLIILAVQNLQLLIKTNILNNKGCSCLKIRIFCVYLIIGILTFISSINLTVS